MYVTVKPKQLINSMFELTVLSNLGRMTALNCEGILRNYQSMSGDSLNREEQVTGSTVNWKPLRHTDQPLG